MPVRSCTVEVERKFRGLAVRELYRTAGTPAFWSLRQLPMRTISDVYFDTPDRQLTTGGAWIRLRNQKWQAKIKQGGTYNNSRFEEIFGADAIAACVKRITGKAGVADDNFGLETMASLVTRRQAWHADNKFNIVLDTMDFGHKVGEVEMEKTVVMGESDEAEQQRKQEIMQEMDNSITAFMRYYAWAFLPGEPVGKLSAYFDKSLRSSSI